MPRSKPNHRSRLRALMKRHELSREDVAGKLGVSASTVDSWLADPSKPWARTMRPQMLKLLTTVLATGD